MSYADELKAITVKIGGKDGGSGILVKPMDASVLYVLTAWHCIKGYAKIEACCLHFDAAIGCEEEVTVKAVYHDQDTDAAIIVVNRFCKEVCFVGFENKENCNSSIFHHTGFPACRADGEEREYRDSTIDKILNDTNNLVEYTYAKAPLKHEVNGMSGGGIFDEHYHLLGIHKQSSRKDEEELLGYARYIPCRHFTALIESNNMSPIGCIDLSSFYPLKNEIFNMDHNKGAKNDLETLLGAISIVKAGLLNKCPKNMFEALQEKRRCRRKISTVCLDKADWARFAEFLLACKLLKGDDINDYDIDKLGSLFQYIYSEKEFDLFDVRNELDTDLIGKYQGKDCVYVIGGISSKGETYDVKIRQNIPDLSVASYSEDFDIADAGNTFLCNLTFVNSHLFRDLMESKGAEIKQAAGKEIETYKSLLEKRIYG